MIKNGTFNTGVTELFPAFHSVGGFVLAPENDVWINFGAADAAVNTGKYIQAGSEAVFSARTFPEMNARISVYAAANTNYSLTPTV